MLAVIDVHFAYPDSGAKFHFNLGVREGCCMVIEGTSGAGKSTLLNLIAGFIHPCDGEIVWREHAITRLAPALRPISMLFQDHNLFEHLDCWTNIAIGINPHLTLSHTEKMLISESLEKLGIAGLEKRLVTSLSGGQQQRVALARALVRSRTFVKIWKSTMPRSLLLLDEPFNALDPETKKGCLEAVKNLVTNHGITALLVSHNPEDAAEIGDDVFRLKSGSHYQ